MFTKPTGVRSSMLFFGKDSIDLPNRWLAIRTTADRCAYSGELYKPPFVTTNKVWEIQDIKGNLIHFWVEELENFYKAYGLVNLFDMIRTEFKLVEKSVYQISKVAVEYPWIKSEINLYNVKNKKLCVATERLWS